MDSATYYSSRPVLQKFGELPKPSDFMQSDGAMPMTRGWAMYQRCHPGEAQVFVTSPDGQGHMITERQARVLHFALSMDRLMTMRAIAAELGMAPSTISRALTRLAFFGVIRYVVGRGRYAGLVVLKRFEGDGMDRFKEAAKERVRRWRKAAQERVSRLRVNVALMYSRKEIEEGVGGYYLSTYYSSMDATLKRTWTVEELREAGIL